MSKLTVAEHLSLDGVMQHSDDGDGFSLGDWTTPYRTPEGRDAVLAGWGERFDLVLGRRTYDLWSAYWPTAPAIPMAERMRAATKHVVTHRAEQLPWGPAVALGADWVEAVRRRKAAEGPDLIVAGSSTLVAPLLETGLVDVLLLVVYPVVLGQGKRLFAGGIPMQSFTLAGTQATPTGVVLHTYRRADVES